MSVRTSAVILACSVFLLSAAAVQAASGPAPDQFRNPILPGFNPDPGFVRIGEDYYIVTSSFEHFPALPLYHSRDLVNWRQLGNVIDRPSQLDFAGISPSAGLFSPVLRQHGGTYYLTFTVLRYLPQQRITNYLVTAQSPAGPWSDPIVITDDSFWRIDTSLFFDDDGRCYFTANRKLDNRRMIVLQEIDVNTGKLIGERYDIGSGARPDSRAAEGAHIYKRDGYYYLLMAEGGTGRGHAVTISRSRKITGPYEQCPSNPILTHRDLPETQQSIWAVGHGELVSTPQGEWWMAVLGRRGRDVLGRETYLVPMRWKRDEWPVVASETGRVPLLAQKPKLPSAPWPVLEPRNEFNKPTLGPEWIFIRPAAEAFWSLSERQGWLRLGLKPETIVTTVGKGTPAFVGQRLPFHRGEVTTRLQFSPASDAEFAGLLLRRGTNTISFGQTVENGQKILRVQAEEVVLTDEDRKRFSGDGLTAAAVTGRDYVRLTYRVPAESGPVHLKAQCRDEVFWSFSYSYDGCEWHSFGAEVDGSLLGENAPGGTYTGTMVGIYGTSHGQPSRNHADFDYFDLRAVADRN